MFAVTDFSDMIKYFKHMFGIGSEFTNNGFFYNISNYGFVLLISIVVAMPVYPLIKKKVKGLRIAKGLVMIILFIVTMSFLVRNTYNPFLYFRF